MKFKSPMFAFAIIIALAPLSAFAATDVTVNALTNCFETDSITAPSSLARVQLTPGRYAVSLINNNMSCYYGSLGSCAINTVILQTQSFGVTNGIDDQASWGVTVKSKQPIIVDISATTNVKASAFIMDTYCGDNTGKAILRFQKFN